MLYVGSDLPSTTWPEATRRHNAEAVVIGVPTVEDVPAVRETVTAVAAAAPDVLVCLGGSRQDDVAGGVPLGHRIGDGATELLARLAREREEPGADLTPSG